MRYLLIITSNAEDKDFRTTNFESVTEADFTEFLAERLDAV